MKNLLIILILLVSSCAPKGEDTLSTSQSIDTRESDKEIENTESEVKIEESLSSSNGIDAVFYKKIFSQLDLGGGSYLDYQGFETHEYVSMSELKASNIHKDLYMLRVSYFYDLCWTPVQIFLLDKDTTLINNFTIGCEKCGCESSSNYAWHMIDDTTYSILEEVYYPGGDTSEIEKIELTLSIRNNGQIDTLNYTKKTEVMVE